MNSKKENFARPGSLLTETKFCKVAFGEIAEVFNIVQDASADEFFNPIYTQPRYQAGLALQLFSVCLLGHIRLPGGIWSRAILNVAKRDTRVVGFILIRDLSSDPTQREIYMCAVDRNFRSQGIGRQLVVSQMKDLAKNATLSADCTPMALMMKRLLRSVGFERSKEARQNIRPSTTQRFIYSVKK